MDSSSNISTASTLVDGDDALSGSSLAPLPSGDTNSGVTLSSNTGNQDYLLPNDAKRLIGCCRVFETDPDGLKAPLADVVFVHGLTGDARDTWSYAKPHHATTFWPRDLLSKEKFPLRVLSFGYKADVAKPFGRVSQAGLDDHANDLLEDLARVRGASSENETRPLIFIGHSLGGLVIERMLHMCTEYSEKSTIKRNIFLCTKSVTTIGTPHKGSNKADIASVFVQPIGIFHPTNKALLATLKTRRSLHFSWLDTYVERAEENAISLWFFYEEEETTYGLIVDRESAVLSTRKSIAKLQGLPADHIAMVKMEDENDIKFLRVWEPVRTVLRNIPARWKNREYSKPTEVTIRLFEINNSTRSFVGRDNEMKMLKHRFDDMKPEGPTPKILALIGPGGVGKSLLARHWAVTQYNEAKNNYEHVMWVDASTRQTTRSSLENIGSTLAHLQGTDQSTLDGEAKIVRLNMFLKTCPSLWLMVFDNWDNTQAFEIDDLWPTGPNGHIIITSRDHRAAEKAMKSIFVKPMSPNDARALFDKRLQEDEKPVVVEEGDNEKVDRLLQNLGRLPLAVEKAASQYLQGPWNIDDIVQFYTDIISENGTDLAWYHKVDLSSSSENLSIQQTRTVFAAIELSFRLLEKSDIYTSMALDPKFQKRPRDTGKKAKQLQKQRQQALELLEICSFLDRTFISEALFDTNQSILLRAKYSRNRNIERVEVHGLHFELEYLSSWKTLIKQSLVEQWESAWDAIPSWTEDTALWKPRAYSLHPLISEVGRERLSTVDQKRVILEAVELLAFHLRVPHDHIMSSAYPEKRALVQHLITLINHEDHYLGRITEEAVDEGLDQVRLGKGRYIQHAILFASFLQDMGYAERAMELYKRILQFNRNNREQYKKEILEAKEGLAIVLIWEEQYEEAYKFCKASLEGNRQIRDEDDPIILRSMHNLGEIQNVRRNWDDAICLFTDARAGFAKLKGDKHFETMREQEALGNAYRARGDYDRAELLIKEALETLEEDPDCGPTSDLTLSCYESYALVKKGQHKFKEAVNYYLKAIDGYKLEVGVEQSGTLGAIEGLADCYRKMGNYTLAAEQYNVVMEHRLRMYVDGERSPNYLRAKKMRDEVVGSNPGPGEEDHFSYPWPRPLYADDLDAPAASPILESLSFAKRLGIDFDDI
ncbi:hypothetical protein TWF694_006959 [Orbilia ellipsospora]|uniref:NB-ARC domain-containing protein n=1 Tax=Orbilia ellipsospora TaxID=2528407 RepID=A0AAV9XPC5_9PEZI